MRKVNLLLTINYIIHRTNDTTFQVAWFKNFDDARQFLEEMEFGEFYEIAEVRR